jgi:hypothetical protein
MIKKTFILLFSSSLVGFFLLSAHKKLIPTPVKTSLIIPCSYHHAHHLYALLKSYEQQTVMPDEVIISLSECYKVEPAVIESIESEVWHFPVKILKSDHIQYAGENRNIACTHAQGDIFILQDADDIPHPQRIEIIKYFFENYEVDHLMHQFFYNHRPKAKISFTKIHNFSSLEIAWPHCFAERKGAYFTNGNSAISKRVFHKIQWSNKQRGQDTEFNKKVYEHYKNLLLVKTPLLCYREFLSSQKT